MIDPNPLLQPSAQPVDYTVLTLDHARAAFEQVLAEHHDGIARLIHAQHEQPTWDDLVLAIDGLDARLMAVLVGFSPLTYQGEDWVELFNDSYGRLLARFDEKLADPTLQALYQRLADSPAGQGLDAHERATLAWYRQAFALHGAALDAVAKAEVVELNQRLYDLAGQFADNLQRPGTLIGEAAQLDGVPPRLLAELAAKAELHGEPGWLIDAEPTMTEAVLEHANRRELREILYRNQHQRGVGDDASNDNGQILQALAESRGQRARILGFPDHAALSLASKSAGSLADVQTFLQDLATRIRPIMQQRRAALAQAALSLGLDGLQPWDRRYLHARQSAHGEALSSETFREHFPLPRVVDALVSLAARLFDVQLVRPTPELPVWHASVLAFEVWLDHALVGHLYLDAVQYPGKQPGQVETRYAFNRRVDAEGLFHPAVAMVFSDVPPGIGETPPLLDHLALRKLFHEFGHALHHLLVRTTTHVNSNITALGADGVEVFGKLLERWVWDADYLLSIARHWQHAGTLQAAPVKALLARLREAELEKTAEDLSLALFDLDLHANPDGERDLRQRLVEARERCGYWPLEDFEHPAHSFDYLLGYYDAGYYAYVWSDVHAFDLFSRFQASGLFDRQTGLDLRRTLIDAGAAQPLRDGMRAFLGREPNAQAFLQWHGLATH